MQLTIAYRSVTVRYNETVYIAYSTQATASSNRRVYYTVCTATTLNIRYTSHHTTGARAVFAIGSVTDDEGPEADASPQPLTARRASQAQPKSGHFALARWRTQPLSLLPLRCRCCCRCRCCWRRWRHEAPIDVESWAAAPRHKYHHQIHGCRTVVDPIHMQDIEITAAQCHSSVVWHRRQGNFSNCEHNADRDHRQLALCDAWQAAVKNMWALEKVCARRRS